LAAFGLLAGSPQQKRAARPILAWLAGAVIAVVAPNKFWDHYFLILLPPLCLLAGLGLAAVVGAVGCGPGGAAAVAVLAGAIAMLPILDTVMPRVANGFGLRQPIRRGRSPRWSRRR
jgi:4-amino-4-deoxy-L-arabinose transferase-like glycosyltransferase